MTDTRTPETHEWAACPTPATHWACRKADRLDTLADLLYQAGVPLPKGRDATWYTEIAERITALQETKP